MIGTHTATEERAMNFTSVTNALPNVLIQDPARECAYYLKADQLAAYKTDGQSWANLNDSTVSFVIPGDDLIDDVPPFLRAPELDPSVLLRHSRSKTSYFLNFEDLQAFKIPQPQESFDPESISFIIPKGTELIEELPSLRRALLQSNTQ